ncbi:MAG: porin [Ralstonia sp.]|nr:MAG: porin [Ralstonia sp.]
MARAGLGWAGLGWAAVFNLTNRFNLGDGRQSPNGASPLFYGESTVGIAGPFGSLRAGRGMTPMWVFDERYDPWANYQIVSSIAWYVFHPSYRTDPYNNGAFGDVSRLNNGLFYDSPTWQGWHAHASVGVDKHTAPDVFGNVDQVRPVAASLNYDAGPWSGMLTAERNSARDNTWFAGVTYDVGAVKVMGSYSQTRLSAASQTFLGDATARRTAATLGAAWNLSGAVTLKAGIGRDFQGYGADGLTDYASLGADYALSKRSTLYVSGGVQKGARVSDIRRIGAGMSHTF